MKFFHYFEKSRYILWKNLHTRVRDFHWARKMRRTFCIVCTVQGILRVSWKGTQGAITSRSIMIHPKIITICSCGIHVIQSHKFYTELQILYRVTEFIQCYRFYTELQILYSVTDFIQCRTNKYWVSVFAGLVSCSWCIGILVR